jgi:hypothetical protein
VPKFEQDAFVAAHPDLYHRAGNTARVTIRDGAIALRSLDVPGLAVGPTPDFTAMAASPAKE